MRIIPAIDIIDGKCVRLTQGDYQKKKVYRENPVEVAKEFEDAGIEYLHLVDLDGAKKGMVVNWEVIEDIQAETALNVDFGGGVKTEREVEDLLELGVNQINIGSLAAQSPAIFAEWIHRYGKENFILSADVIGEKVKVAGWQEDGNINLFDLTSQLTEAGLKYITCTDISTDGMLQGPNFNLYRKLRNRFPELKIIASGGITSCDDIEELKYMKLHGAIIGKAIYEGKITLNELKSVI
jgi:phosphoribosylformimino-5-aminoimidazole carboxamide ribotide isomerase